VEDYFGCVCRFPVTPPSGGLSRSCVWLLGEPSCTLSDLSSLLDIELGESQGCSLVLLMLFARFACARYLASHGEPNSPHAPPLVKVTRRVQLTYTVLRANEGQKVGEHSTKSHRCVQDSSRGGLGEIDHPLHDLPSLLLAFEREHHIGFHFAS